MISQAARIGGEFVVIKAQLVREVGGYNEAAVASLIIFSTEGIDTPYATANGWWPATYDQIANRLGLSPDQVRRALAKLVEDGHVERLKLKLGGISDHTYSYRLVREDRQNDLAESPHLLDVAESPHLPSIKKEKKDTHDLAPDRFDEFWSLFPKHVAKAPAHQAWLKATKTTDPDVILGRLRLQLPGYQARDPKYVPSPTTYLNQARWDDDPDPVAKSTGKNGGPRVPVQNEWEYR